MLLNILEREGQFLRVRENRLRTARLFVSHVLTSAVLIGFGVWAWDTQALPLILFAVLQGALTLPLTLFGIYLDSPGLFRNRQIIRLEAGALEFLFGSRRMHRLGPGDIRELVLMPSKFGQTLIVLLTDERAWRARAPWADRLCTRLTRLYCGHAIGLTPNLAAADVVAFIEALDQAFPNRVCVLKKAAPHSLLGRLLGNVRRPETPLPVSFPPPLSEV